VSSLIAHVVATINPIIKKNKKNNMTIVGLSIFNINDTIEVINDAFEVVNNIILMKNSKYTVSLESYGWGTGSVCAR
jgi:hypothetical protein